MLLTLVTFRSIGKRAELWNGGSEQERDREGQRYREKHRQTHREKEKQIETEKHAQRHSA